MLIKHPIKIGLSVVTLFGTMWVSRPVQAVSDRPIALSPPSIAQNPAMENFQRVAQAEKATIVQYSPDARILPPIPTKSQPCPSLTPSHARYSRKLSPSPRLGGIYRDWGIRIGLRPFKSGRSPMNFVE
jgi:hypothetical protein